MAHIVRFLASCLSLFFGSIGSGMARLVAFTREVTVDAFRIAFPPDPQTPLARANYTLAMADAVARRRDARFAAFIARAKFHDHYLGGRFKLLRSPLLAV